MRAGVALGSNLGDRLENLIAARLAIRGAAGVEGPVVASAVYETEPVGCEPGAPKFLNAVVEVAFSGQPAELLRELRSIETRLGRPAAHVRNTSRTIDLDLLYCGDMQLDTSELQLPHPRLHDRRFVLEPLADIRPDLVLPGQSETVSTLLRRLPEAPALVCSATQW